MVIVRALAALGLSALVLVAAGCGSAKSPSVASLGPALTTKTPSSGPSGSSGHGSFQRFVRCMQLHGVHAEIGAGGNGVSISGGPGQKPLVDKANAACQKYLPGGGPKAMTPAQQARMIQRLRALAKCMRKNGFPAFPDPTAGGGLQLNANNGLDPQSPRFRSAMTKCAGAGGPKGKGPIGFSVQGKA